MAAGDVAVLVIGTEGLLQDRVQSHLHLLQEEGFIVLKRRQFEPTAEEQSILSSTFGEKSEFTGVHVALLLKRRAGLAHLLTLAPKLDHTYISGDEYLVLRDRSILFPETLKLERTVAIIKPGIAAADAKEIEQTFSASGFTTLQSLQATLTSDVTKVVGDNDEQQAYLASGESTILVLEGLGAITKAKLLAGSKDSAQARAVAPASLRARFGLNAIQNAVHVSESEQAAAKEFEALFPQGLPFSRTVAIIRPEAAAYTNAILDDFSLYGFTVLTQERQQLSKQRAEEFYADSALAGRAFDDAVIALSSGPVVVLLLSKSAAVESLKALLGSLRARFGASAPRNSIYASETAAQADSDARFFFPSLRREDIPNKEQIKTFLIEKRRNAPAETDKSLNDVLVDALTHLCRKKPVGLDAIRELAQYLLANNPNKPRVSIPADAPDASTVGEKLLAAHNNESVKVVFAVGLPGSRMEQQLKEAQAKLGYIYLDAPALLHNSKSYVKAAQAEAIEHALQEGRQVSAPLVTEVLSNAITAAKSTKFVIGGFPSYLDYVLDFEAKVAPASALLFFDCAEETSIARGGENEADLMAKLVHQQLDLVMPVVDHYNSFKKLVTINCDQSEERVFQSVKRALISL